MGRILLLRQLVLQTVRLGSCQSRWFSRLPPDSSGSESDSESDASFDELLNFLKPAVSSPISAPSSVRDQFSGPVNSELGFADDFASPRNHINAIRLRYQQAVGTVVSQNLQRLLRLVSDKLYAQDSHFILELLQNADDNVYEDRSTPTVWLECPGGVQQ
eukprot:NODE_5634_length_654_cov_28.028099_g5250_i0.p1 GENE.NODE_5634_length_654_cov_28.028099_g5250_i0~~NODE_5634_length_654_cov_28.028099_g5250_i0.p1  ORF type:complete len:160 (-),score=31.80 NODE_5634_length_654_cov_28.028099_g5250_i0:84-563(-)